MHAKLRSMVYLCKRLTRLSTSIIASASGVVFADAQHVCQWCIGEFGVRASTQLAVSSAIVDSLMILNVLCATAGSQRVREISDIANVVKLAMVVQRSASLKTALNQEIGLMFPREIQSQGVCEINNLCPSRMFNRQLGNSVRSIRLTKKELELIKIGQYLPPLRLQKNGRRWANMLKLHEL